MSGGPLGTAPTPGGGTELGAPCTQGQGGTGGWQAVPGLRS